tara:strand:+ start:161 stop:361 length:201 start_codon:yes stop_codon:yes gene_type:complete
MSEEKEFNPLEGWTKEQIKSTLKAHTKTELLTIAMQWRILAENYMQQLKQNNDDTTAEDTPLESDS